MLKAQGNPRAPQDIAQEIISNLKYSDPFFDKVTIIMMIIISMCVYVVSFTLVRGSKTRVHQCISQT